MTLKNPWTSTKNPPTNSKGRLTLDCVNSRLNNLLLVFPSFMCPPQHFKACHFKTKTKNPITSLIVAPSSACLPLLLQVLQLTWMRENKVSLSLIRCLSGSLCRSLSNDFLSFPEARRLLLQPYESCLHPDLTLVAARFISQSLLSPAGSQQRFWNWAQVLLHVGFQLMIIHRVALHSWSNFWRGVCHPFKCIYMCILAKRILEIK